jgi:hypothetical protein
MSGDSASRIDGMSDTDKLYELGLAQAIDESVSRFYRNSFSIRITAIFFKCLILYGTGLESHLLISQP